MSKRTLTIDQFYTYEVQDVLEGGMGYVLLLNLVEQFVPHTFEGGLLENSKLLQQRFRYPYRKQLAAKTVKNENSMMDFARECNLWLKIEDPGMVPVLKVVKVDGLILALMPRYAGNLRDIMNMGIATPAELMKMLYQPIVGLSSVYKKHKPPCANIGWYNSP